MSLVVAGAVTFIDLWIYLLVRADQELARVNAEMAELRAEFASKIAANPEVWARMPREWRELFGLVLSSGNKPRDVRLN